MNVIKRKASPLQAAVGQSSGEADTLIEDMCANIFSYVLNDVNRSIAVLYMSEASQPADDIKSVLSRVHPYFGAQKKSDFNLTILAPLYDIGAVSKVTKEDCTNYSLTKYGAELIAPIAAHARVWFYQHSKRCMREVLGRQCGAKIRPPYQRVKIIRAVESFREKSTGEAKDATIEMIVDNIKVPSTEKKDRYGYIRRHLAALSELGLLDYQTAERKEGFTFYRWIKDHMFYPSIDRVENSEVQNIVLYLFEKRNQEEMVSPNQAIADLGIKTRVNAYTVFDVLTKAGYLQKTEGDKFKTNVRSTDELKRINGLFEDIGQAVEAYFMNRPSLPFEEMKRNFRRFSDDKAFAKHVLDEMASRYLKVVKA